MSKFTEWESRNKEQFDEQKRVEIENLKRKRDSSTQKNN